jgi:hypothetical protein
MTELVPTTPVPAIAVADNGELPDVIGAAADHFAEVMLSASPGTQRTYQSTYARFNDFLVSRARARAITAAKAAGMTIPEDELPTTVPFSAFTANPLARYFRIREAEVSPATVRKERAALNQLARYLHLMRVLDATEILVVPTARRTPAEVEDRDALDEPTWMRVKAIARQRLTPPPRGRASQAAARRDLAMVLLLGDMGLRSDEVRSLPRHGSLQLARSDGSRLWLRVVGKGGKERLCRSRLRSSRP